ncbi:DsbA family protein [Bacillus anthracis]|uniref:DsbA family protein n=1 Tax=Bacillus TaxID=1386 RepID=UPI000BF3FE6D|nr:DsbA family protein [Bacillus cereus group sp. BfR-BA-01352]PFC87865.1 DsbA family protein [Bacillus anthracis]PFT26160.1 DsbA family protein [Bacillus thuringiensis]PFD87681.1 DsbA family protein [Bacillus anthracis]PFE29361.1 DsbA family protein [Bacillus anthracis]PFR04855.1 DsbA family protein [Bacillus anthracis]
METKQDNLIYVWDAYCGWCYGFSDSIKGFYKNHTEMPLTVLCGGLFLDNLPMKNFSYIEEGNKRINQLTGAEFGPSYQKLVEEGTFKMNSKDAAIGFSALRSLAPDRLLEFTSAMQKAFYYEGQSLSDPETYRKIAIEHGLDPEQVLDRLNTQETVIDVQNDFNKVRQLGVNSYPSLLLQKDNQIIPIGGGVMTPDKIEARFKSLY